MPKQGLHTRKREEIFCQHCLNIEKAPRGRKETPEEKAARERRNEENTLIYRKTTVNGKVVEVFGEIPWTFEKVDCHKHCLMAWLQKKFKKDEQKVAEAYQIALEERNKKLDKSRPKGKLTAEQVSVAKSQRINKENLINYFMGHYGTSIISKKILSLIKCLDEGTSNDYGNVVISYEKLLDMFLYYEDDLFELYKKNLKKGKAPSNATQRIIYDLAVVVYNLDEYDSRKQSKFSQQDEREEIIDVTKYIRRDKKKEEEIEKERREEIRKAREFADEMTKEYDEEDNSYIASLFKDD